MTLRSDGRRVISATMQPELYDRLYAHCKELDIPVTVFVREAISKALPMIDQPIKDEHLPNLTKLARKSLENQSFSSDCYWAMVARGPYVHSVLHADAEPTP